MKGSILAEAPVAGEGVEADNGLGVLYPGDRLHPLVHEAADIGLGVHRELRQQVKRAGDRMDLAGLLQSVDQC